MCIQVKKKPGTGEMMKWRMKLSISVWRFPAVFLVLACLASFISLESQGFTKTIDPVLWMNEQPLNPLEAGSKGHPDILFRVNHDPQGPTLNHDYYDPSSRELIRLVEGAHVDPVLPNIKKSFRAPDTLKKGFLVQALNDIKYTLGRLVNHPKALALSATVGRMMNRPNLPIPFYQRALKLYPQRAITHAQFGNFLVSLGELEDGIERLHIAIEIDSTLAIGYGWLAWAYQKDGDADSAAEYARQAKDLGFKGKLPDGRSDD